VHTVGVSLVSHQARDCHIPITWRGIRLSQWPLCVCVHSEFYWANYATGLGAALHELAHTFDLAHSPTGVMSRGFDDIHRFFTVVTPVASFRGLTSSCHVQRSYSPTACSATQSPVRQTAVCQHSLVSYTHTPSHASSHTRTIQQSFSWWTWISWFPLDSLPPSPPFLQARCPSCRPTNSVKALKATSAFGLRRKR